MKLYSVVLLLILAAALSFGQTANGQLTGIISDSSGAVIAGINVVATAKDTGIVLSGTTSQTGLYTIPQMPVGRYEVTITQSGFKTFKKEDVTISAEIGRAHV